MHRTDFSNLDVGLGVAERKALAVPAKSDDLLTRKYRLNDDLV